MRLFYAEKLINLHFREIARRTKLFEPSVYRFLNSLEKEQILKSKKDGNLKKYVIRRSTRTYFVFEAFDLDRFEKLPSIWRNAIKMYLDNLPEKPVFAILFGSTAKNTYTKGSDIDILLVTNSAINPVQAEKETNALASMKISTFQITFKEFVTDLKMKEDKVIQSAINSGYPLINHILYYETMYNERV